MSGSSAVSQSLWRRLSDAWLSHMSSPADSVQAARG
jgi:hypothetical protein